MKNKKVVYIFTRINGIIKQNAIFIKQNNKQKKACNKS